MNNPGDRSGIAVLSTLLGVTVLTLLLVSALPLVMHADRERRVLRTAAILEEVRLAIDDPSVTNKAFGQRVGAYPGRLTQLIYPIARNNATNFPNSCGSAFTAPQTADWESWGPFLGFQIDESLGLPTPIGIGNNILVRNPASGGGAAVLSVVFPSVDETDVLLLDNLSDGATGSTAGVIRWSAPSSGVTTMEYQIAITGC